MRGGSDSEDMGDEFDDNQDLVSQAVPKKSTQRKRKAGTEGRHREGGQGQKGGEGEDRHMKKKRGRQWSADEDEALRKLYAIYAGSSSVFNVIAQSEEMT